MQLKKQLNYLKILIINTYIKNNIFERVLVILMN